MDIKFSEYVGLAGDLQAMLIAETNDGRRETVLFNRSSFYEINRWIAEEKLLWRLNRKLGYKEKRQLRETLRLQILLLKEEDEKAIVLIEAQMIYCKGLSWKDYKRYVRVM